MAFTETEQYALMRTLAPYANALEILRDTATTLANREQTIIQRHATYGLTDTAETVESTLDSVRASIQGACQELVTQCRAVITDKSLVIPNLPVPPTAGFNEVAAALVAVLENADDTITATVTNDEGELVSTRYQIGPSAGPMSCSVPVSLPTAVEDGTRVILFVLTDAVTPPSNTVIAIRTNVGQISQAFKIPGEEFVIALTGDSESGGLPPGQERYRIYSKNTGSTYSGLGVSSGDVTNVTTAHTNGEALVSASSLTPLFEDDVPAGWTVAGGTAGTSFEEDTTHTFRGASTLGIPANQTFELTKTIPAAALTRGRYYALYWWERAAAQGAVEPVISDVGVSSSQGLGTAVFTRTYGASASNLHYGQGAKWRLRWKIYLAQETQPATELTIRVKSTGTNTAASLATIGIAPIDYYGGVGYLLVPGDNNPLIGTQFNMRAEAEVEIYDTDPFYFFHGRWSQFFTEALGIQLITDGDNAVSDDPEYDQMLGPPASDAEDLDSVPAP